MKGITENSGSLEGECRPLTSRIVKLNVGGTRYEVSYNTLLRFPDSMLARMFDESNEELVRTEEDGGYFIDRDGSLFGIILQLCRTGSISEGVLANPLVSAEALAVELDFFGLPGIDSFSSNVLMKMKVKEAVMKSKVSIQRDIWEFIEIFVTKLIPLLLANATVQIHGNSSGKSFTCEIRLKRRSKARYLKSKSQLFEMEATHMNVLARFHCEENFVESISAVLGSKVSITLDASVKYTDCYVVDITDYCMDALRKMD